MAAHHGSVGVACSVHVPAVPAGAWAQSLLHQWIYYFAWRVGMQLRVSISCLVFAKVRTSRSSCMLSFVTQCVGNVSQSMRLRLDTLAQKTSGTIVNLISTDIERCVPYPLHVVKNLM